MGIVNATVDLATALTGSRETRSAAEMTDRAKPPKDLSADEIEVAHYHCGWEDAKDYPDHPSAPDSEPYMRGFRARKAALAAQPELLENADALP